jgi:ATP-dependent Clp protease adaptor protein ClpS
LIAEDRPLVGMLRSGIARLARMFSAPRAAPAILAVREPKGAREPKRNGDNPGAGAAVITRTRAQTRRPNMYRVLLLNDDYTPMEFVIAILQAFFNKTSEEATQIMLHVHNNGVGECGVYTYEVAETKVAQVMDHARKNQHPLQCIMEKK